MKIDGIVVDKKMPEWARGQLAEVEGKFLLLLHAEPRKVWPRWWHKFGKRIDWRWLQHLHWRRDRFMA